jgi:hypothetical protein
MTRDAARPPKQPPPPQPRPLRRPPQAWCSRRQASPTEHTPHADLPAHTTGEGRYGAPLSPSRLTGR